MNRRHFIRTSAAFAAGAAVPSCRRGAADFPIHFEVHGPEDGLPLFLAFPLFASYAEIFGAEQAVVKEGFLNRLTDRYRVLLVDYPNVGRTHTPPPAELTPDRVYSDLLSVADAAGFDRFAYCGHLWGAVNGLMLASRSDRVSALICGTWPPLGAPYADMLRGVELQLAEPPPHAMVILRDPGQYAQWHTFYLGMQDWDEEAAVASIACPRLALIGSEVESAVVGIPLRLTERVREIAGAETGAILDAGVMVPEMRRFLE